jgi:prepilin peptidase CpaA
LDIFYAIFVVGCFVAALYDVISYRIPNLVVILLFALFIFKVIAFQDYSALLSPLIAFGVTIIVGFGLFAFRLLGGGDAKLLAVAVLWASEVNLILFFLLTSIFGAVLAILYKLFEIPIENYRQKVLSWLRSAFEGMGIQETLPDYRGQETLKSKTVMPYGVAIFLGSFFLTYFNT